jgi:hypothetical protein
MQDTTHAGQQTQAALLDAPEAPGKDAPRRILQRFGFDTLPARSVLVLTQDRILIPDAALIPAQDINDMARTIRELGGHILEPPGVALAPGSVPDWDAPEARFQIIWGRKRTLGAWQAGLPAIECIVYHAYLTPELHACLAAIENLRRRNSWRQEVAYLHQLISGRVALSEDDLVKELRLDRPLVQVRLAIARLPGPLVELITSSRQVSQQTAFKMTRLSLPNQNKLSGLAADLAAQGGRFCRQWVDDAWLSQLNTGLLTPSLVSVLHTEMPEAQADGPVPQHNGTTPAGDPSQSQASDAPTIEEVLALFTALKRQAIPRRMTVLLEALQEETIRWYRAQQAQP